MPEVTISPTYFKALACEGDTYADARAGVNGLTASWQYVSVGQSYRAASGYHVERLVGYFNLTGLVGMTITSAILHVKFVDKRAWTFWDENWDWDFSFRANPNLNLGSAELVANFLAALEGTVFSTKHAEDCVGYIWYTFDVKIYVTPPTFTLSVVSDKDKNSIAPAPSNTIEVVDFRDEYFTPGETDRFKLVIEYDEPIVAPTVTTDPATAIGITSATLNGILNNDGGGACDCGFEWGETIAYEHGATPTDSKTTGQSFSQVIIGLAPNTTYHFRAFATNSAGTSYGADRTFTTQELLIISRAYALAREEL